MRTQSIEIGIGHLFMPDLARGGPPRRSRILHSLAALYLVVALTIPGAFVIAKQAAVAGSGVAAYPAVQAEQHDDGDGKKAPEKGPKRMRGVLHAKVAADSVLASVVLFRNYEPLVEDTRSNLRPVYADPKPEGRFVSPQLLQRPPPHNG